MGYELDLWSGADEPPKDAFESSEETIARLQRQLRVLDHWHTLLLILSIFVLVLIVRATIVDDR